MKDLKRRTVDCRPDVQLLAVNDDLRLVDGRFLSLPAVQLEQVLQPVKPLPDRLVRAVNERFDPSVRKRRMIQNRRENTSTEQRALT